MAFAVKKHCVPVCGTYMDCVSFGRGEKPLVILPGLGIQSVRTAAFMLAHMYRSFGKDFRVYIFDKPRDVREGCTVAELAGLTAGAVTGLGLEGACVLGVSMGGMLALELAIEHPELVAKVVPALTAAAPNAALTEAIGTWTAQVSRGAYPDFIRDMFERLYSPGYLRRYRLLMPLLCRLVSVKESQRFVRLAAACLTVDCYDRLPRISCPALVIGAQEDRVVTAEASTEIAEALGCPLHIYPGLGHAAYEELSRDFNRRVLAFFRG